MNNQDSLIKMHNQYANICLGCYSIKVMKHVSPKQSKAILITYFNFDNQHETTLIILLCVRVDLYTPFIFNH